MTRAQYRADRSERHVLYRRDTLEAEPVEVGVYATYRGAVEAGMRKCGHGKFWVDSQRKTAEAHKWTEFTPDPISIVENGLAAFRTSDF